MPDPKPERIRLPHYQLNGLKIYVKVQFGRRCACGCGRRADSVHHLLGGAWKEDVEENLVPLAGDGTRLCHGAITSGNTTDGCDPDEVARGIRARLERDFPEKITYMVGKVGPDVVDRMYPPEKEVQQLCEHSSQSPPRPSPSLHPLSVPPL